MNRTLRMLPLLFLSLGAMLTTNAQWPIHIEAENYLNTFGTQKILCAEGTTGNKAVQLNTHDWVEYDLNLPQDSIYRISVRVAGTAANIWVYDTSWNILGKLFMYKGGMDYSTDQTYTTYRGLIHLKSSNDRVRLQFKQPGHGTKGMTINFNWLEVEPTNLIVANDFDSDWDILSSVGNVPWKSDLGDSTRSLYESSPGFYGWIKQTARPASMQINTSMSGHDRSYLRFELAKSDSTLWPYVRSEMYKGHSPYQTAWYRFSFMCINDLSSDGLPHVFFQTHGQGGGLSPNISIRVENNRYVLKVLWSAIFNPTIHQGETVYDLGPYVQYQWEKWVLYVKYAWDNTGMLRLWRNDVEIVTRLNLPNCYNEAKWPYPKFGIYKWGWTPQWAHYSPYDVLTHCFDSLRIGGPSSSYSEVNY